MARFFRALAIAGALALAATQAFAQAKIPSGYWMGNSGSLDAPVRPDSGSNHLDRAFGATQNKALYRGPSGWTPYDLSSFARTYLDDADQATTRTTLGVGTSDSPQFAGINLGHASDTTITRSASGKIAVEGVDLLRTIDLSVANLTLKASPVTNDNVPCFDSAASDVLKRCTVGSIGSVGAVASWNNQTGAVVSRYAPGGRITLASGTPVMRASQAAASSHYWTPYNGDQVPLYDGTALVPTTFAETSQAASDTTKSPAAVVANATYPIYCWTDSGTKRCTRADYWKKATTVTMTIASPAVVTWNSHALKDGEPIVFTTSGALPTGIVSGTTYYVKSPSSNSFNVAATVGGSAINTTGSQSGTHTGTAADNIGTTALGASGNAELDYSVGGFALNKNAVTNGPGALRGTYVGIVKSNASALYDYIYGASASGGTAAVFNLWNMYNREWITTTVTDSNAGYQYTTGSGAIRQAGGSAGNQVSFVLGQVQGVQAQYTVGLSATNVTGTKLMSGICVDATTLFAKQPFYLRNPQNTNVVESGGSSGGLFQIATTGSHYIAACEQNPSDQANNFFNLNGNAQLDVGLFN